MKVQGIVALAVVAIAIAACGGGGGGGSAPSGSTAVLPAATSTPTSAALPAGYAVDAVTISMAKGTYSTTSIRRAQTVGTGTESVVFTLLQQNGVPTTGTPQIFGLIQTSPGCTVNTTTQALTCVLPVDAPIGQDVFLAQTYDQSNGTGNLTGSGAVALTVGQNTTNTASIVLNAQVAAVYVVSQSQFLGNEYGDYSIARRGAQALGAHAVHTQAVRTPLQTFEQSTPVYVIAVDSSNNTILNPSAYNAPIYLLLAFDEYDCGAYSCDQGVYDTPDVTLTVTYGSNDPSPCTPNGTATAAGWFGQLALCSPSDSVTASLAANGGLNPSEDAYIYGFITSVAALYPSPAPSQTPVPLPTPTGNTYADIYVYYPTPSPSPTSTPTCPPGQGCQPVNVQ